MSRQYIKIERHCVTCGITFFVCPWRLKKGANYCSRKCRGKAERVGPAEERFKEFIGETNERGCIVWSGYKSHDGYGRFYMGNNITVAAHRFSYEINCGPIPDNLQVLHKCDNPPCVNPEHLFLGTPNDNAKDRAKKGRQQRHHGESNPNSKVSVEDVKEIRKMHKQGYTSKQIAELFPIASSSIRRIYSRKDWKHI
jgi:hypothetical protein